MSETVFAVVVTHRRRDELATSLDVLSSQTRMLDHLIVVDNDGPADGQVRDLVAGQPVSTTYLDSRRNLGGAGGFALGMLHALAQGADWVWLADDDGRPQDNRVLATLLACAEKYGLAEVSPMVCNLDDPQRLAFPLRRAWSGAGAPASCAPKKGRICCAGSRRCSTARCFGLPPWTPSVSRTCAVHPRRRSRIAPQAGAIRPAVRHLPGCDLPASQRIRRIPADSGRPDAHPVPRRPTKRFFTYRNRGYLMAQPGLRKLLPQEWLRFGWFFLVSRRDPKGMRDWIRLRRMGRRERFGKPEAGGSDDVHRRGGQSRTFARARRDLTDGFHRRELWLHLGWQDIKQRYRRSVLGPFWITIATGTTAWRWRLVLQAVSPRAVCAPALRDARADHLEPDQRRHPGGRRRVRRQ